jgi:hypothetical protein
MQRNDGMESSLMLDDNSKSSGSVDGEFELIEPPN